ncbi:MAG: endonuclease IV, partial [Candidatus Aenigmatarchaeota archaeon]
FKPLAQEILRRKLGITIICESPVLEMDALRMKKIFESLGCVF